MIEIIIFLIILFYSKKRKKEQGTVVNKPLKGGKKVFKAVYIGQFPLTKPKNTLGFKFDVGLLSFGAFGAAGVANFPSQFIGKDTFNIYCHNTHSIKKKKQMGWYYYNKSNKLKFIPDGTIGKPKSVNERDFCKVYKSYFKKQKYFISLGGALFASYSDITILPLEGPAFNSFINWFKPGSVIKGVDIDFENGPTPDFMERLVKLLKKVKQKRKIKVSIVPEIATQTLEYYKPLHKIADYIWPQFYNNGTKSNVLSGDCVGNADWVSRGKCKQIIMTKVLNKNYDKGGGYGKIPIRGICIPASKSAAGLSGSSNFTQEKLYKAIQNSNVYKANKLCVATWSLFHLSDPKAACNPSSYNQGPIPDACNINKNSVIKSSKEIIKFFKKL